ncbi:MAG TPA: T9SS type A sorting domain-containing protein [Bacteroidia bacterium]
MPFICLINNRQPISKCDTFSVRGTLFNGISEGTSYGDDWQMATNYPIVQLTSGAYVYYARTFNWNSTGVQRGSLPDNVTFQAPATLPSATYSLTVIANGISPNPFTFNYLNCGSSIHTIQDSKDGVSIYPNPNTGSFHIDYTGISGEAVVNVYDINGKLVLSQTMNGKTTIDASSLNDGIYNVNITNSDGVVNKRIVVVR